MKRKVKKAIPQKIDEPKRPALPMRRPLPTMEQLRTRAYEISIARGGGPGHELDDWLLAENELKAEIELQMAKSTE